MAILASALAELPPAPSIPSEPVNQISHQIGKEALELSREKPLSVTNG